MIISRLFVRSGRLRQLAALQVKMVAVGVRCGGCFAKPPISTILVDQVIRTVILGNMVT